MASPTPEQELEHAKRQQDFREACARAGIHADLVELALAPAPLPMTHDAAMFSHYLWLKQNAIQLEMGE